MRTVRGSWWTGELISQESNNDLLPLCQFMTSLAEIVVISASSEPSQKETSPHYARFVLGKPSVSFSLLALLS